MTRVARVVLPLVLILVGCQPPPAGFHDEFTGPTLDNARWYPNRWFASVCAPGATTNELGFYRPQNVTLVNGMLVLTAKAESNTCAEAGPPRTLPFTSGWVQTGGSRSAAATTVPTFAFTFGRVDVRFKAPAGHGLWPAIWLQPLGTPDAQGRLPYPSYPEVDIVELYGDKVHDWNFHLHDSGIHPGVTFTGPDWSADYHVMSLDWRHDRLTFLVDNVARWTYTGPGIPQQQMYLIINLAVGGFAGGPDPKAFPAQMLIDYVHISP